MTEYEKANANIERCTASASEYGKDIGNESLNLAYEVGMLRQVYRGHVQAMERQLEELRRQLADYEPAHA